MWLFLLLLLLLLLSVYIFYKWGYTPFQVFKEMNIPGPPPLPFLGNLIPLVFRKEGMKVIAEWNRKYGATCGYFCGTWPAVSTADPVLIQKFFITNFRQFTARGGIMSLMNTQATGLPPGIFEDNRLYQWKKIRHITQPAFSKAKLAMMSHHIERSCSVMVDRMIEQSSSRQNIDIIMLYRDYVLEAAILAVLGREVWLQKGEAHEFKCWIELGSNIGHGRHPLSQLYIYLPIDLYIGHQFTWFVKFYYWLSLGRFVPVFRKLKATLTDCIKERKERARLQQLQENCVLNLMVAAVVGDSELSDEEMMSHCLNYLFAAYDTTSLTLTCATHLLATNPRVQDKLCILIDDYWDQNKGASVSTVAQELSYLDMVLDETMRLYPPAPREGRRCTESVELCGIPFPKGMTITVPVTYLHRIESIWGDPDVFRPERFEREEAARRPPCCYLPMGLGPRNCVGLKLARFIMKVALVSVLQRHHFIRTQRTEDVLDTDCYCINLTLTSDVFVDIQPRK